MVKKTGPGHCPEQQLIAQRPSMINQAREVFCQGRFPASLISLLYVSHRPLSRRLLCRFPLVILQQAAQSPPALHLFPSCPRLKRKTICNFSAPGSFQNKCSRNRDPDRSAVELPSCSHIEVGGEHNLLPRPRTACGRRELEALNVEVDELESREKRNDTRRFVRRGTDGSAVTVLDEPITNAGF